MSKRREPIAEIDGNHEIPADLERALNGSVGDLLQDRTEDVDDFLARMEAKLQDHLAARTGSAGPMPMAPPVITNVFYETARMWRRAKPDDGESIDF